MAKIEKLPSGTYRTRIYIGKDAEGQKHWKTMTHSDPIRLKRLAAEFEDEHREKKQSGTIQTAIERYISAKSAVLSPATHQGYNCYLRTLKREYGPFLGCKVDMVRQQTYQALINQMIQDGKSVKYVGNIKGLIDAAFRFAEYTPPSVKLPARQKPDLYNPTKEDCRELLKAVKGTDLDVPVRLAIHGLRRSEICGLTLKDVTPEYVHVHAATVRGTKGFTSKPTPKTVDSDRFVPIDRKLYAMIQKQGCVTQMKPDMLTKKFKKTISENGLPDFRLHDLRHFFAAYMHDQNFTDAQIMQMGGWKTDSVMKRVYRYALMDKNENRKAAKSLSKLS